MSVLPDAFGDLLEARAARAHAPAQPAPRRGRELARRVERRDERDRGGGIVRASERVLQVGERIDIRTHHLRAEHVAEPVGDVAQALRVDADAVTPLRVEAAQAAGAGDEALVPLL